MFFISFLDPGAGTPVLGAGRTVSAALRDANLDPLKSKEPLGAFHVAHRRAAAAIYRDGDAAFLGGLPAVAYYDRVVPLEWRV